MLLFKDRNLNIAILVSFTWHLVFMLLVTPVIISGRIRKNATVISFLGSILENVVTIPEKSLGLNKASFMGKIERIKDMVLGELSLNQPEVVSMPISTQPDKAMIVSFLNKDSLPILKPRPERNKKMQMIKFKDSMITGEAGSRVVLYRPELPMFSVIPSNFTSGYKTVVGFRISRYGFVYSPECIISSGSSEIDELAIRHIRKWQFIPHDDVQKAVVRLSFGD